MDLFNFVKNQLEIINVISEYTSLKKTGSQYWKGLCPFHHEKTPSFTVSPHKKIFYCFGCHLTGDVINFIEKIENISAFQATQHLVKRYNLDVPESLLETSNSLKQEKTIFQLCQLVGQWCNTKLSKEKAATTYLQNRSIKPATISQFSIGFFPDGSKNIQDLLSHIHKHGFSSEDLLNEHIIFQGKTGLYSPFENRIIFPIKDHLGHTCGFGGRIFQPHDQRPKYYNSKETMVFKKGKILFGLDLAKHEIQKQKIAFIVEGYTDCIAMHQHGYPNTVATLGTACTLDHLKQLARHAQTIYMLYDSDNAGQQAMLKLAQSCWQLDMELKVIILPTDQDPASLLEQENNLEPYILQAVDIFTYFLQSMGREYQKSSMKDKIGAITDLLELINNIQDELKQNILLIKASEIIQVPLEILKKEYNNRNKQDKGKEPLQAEQATIQSANQMIPEQDLELQILACIYYDPSLITKQHETLLYAKLTEPIKIIIEKMIVHYNNDQKSLGQNMEQVLTAQELQYVQQASFKIETSNTKQLFQNLMIQFQKKHWKSLASHIKMKMMQAKQSNNKKEMLELIEIFESLKKIYINRGVYD